MGQRLSGATIGRSLSDYHARTRDYPATFEPAAATIPRLSSDYPATIGNALPGKRVAFLIVDELAVANQWDGYRVSIC